MHDTTTTVIRARPIAVPRVWTRDGVFVALAIAQACVLAIVPSVPFIAVGLWWNANTVSHNFIHRPFFRSRGANAAFSAFLSVVLGVPQRLWRARHLAHHAELAGGVARVRWTPAMFAETGLVIALWTTIVTAAPQFFLTVYVPGWAIGLGLCFLQGHFEHAQGTVSHYGRLYNLLFFNDGYHAEHHARPGACWTDLPSSTPAGGSSSRWPAVLRWLDWFSLDSLERLVLHSPILQHFVVSAHESAFARLLASLPEIRRVAIVGGGLFPRTAIVLGRLLPRASLVVIDANPGHLALARTMIGERAEYRLEHWDARQTETADLVVIPLAFQGDRRRLYERPPAAATIVHDWLWRPAGTSTRVSWLLCKRLNLVRR
jgi:fatty acid desaturase